MDRAVPPPSPLSPRAPQPEPPPNAIRSHGPRKPRANDYGFFSGSQDWRILSASPVLAPEPRAQRDWGGGRCRGLEPRFGGRQGSPAPRLVRCTPAHRTPTRRFSATSAACRLSSAVQSLSSLGSRPPGPGGDRQRDERFGRSKARSPCLSAEVLRESPLDPERGEYAGWGAKLGEQAKAFRLSTRSP